MRYHNPVIKGFYPDPSVCRAGDKYYLVCSSFQYFPAVPLFESGDLVNWKQIGHCLTRKSQIMLNKIDSSGGVFAPTIRYFDGRFFMTTTNASAQQNFYVWTDDIYSEWSEPIFVDQGGIDPSLMFDDGKVYFLSTGQDDEGKSGIIQCQIDIKTGQKLTPSKCIWQGTGGRYLEAPHMYKINDWYYLVAAEGGTEYGHMVTYARARSPEGKFENYAHNPVLTNRNLGAFELQGMGHGDLISDKCGDWFLVHLGFRQIKKYLPFHHLGREVFLTPVKFDLDGWFSAGQNGEVVRSFEIKGDFVQQEKKVYTFQNTDPKIDWCYLRHPNFENYIFQDNKYILIGTDITLDDKDSPAFIALRQKDFEMEITCDVKVLDGEGGITLYMDENHHYDLAILKDTNGIKVIKKLNIGDIKTVHNYINISSSQAQLIIRSDNLRYYFGVQLDGQEYDLGSAQTRYLSSEVAGGFTGVMIGLYALGDNNTVEFENFKCVYK